MILSFTGQVSGRMARRDGANSATYKTFAMSLMRSIHRPLQTRVATGWPSADETSRSSGGAREEEQTPPASRDRSVRASVAAGGVKESPGGGVLDKIRRGCANLPIWREAEVTRHK